VTGRATFGDFAQVARARLDEAIADDERAERPWKAAALARQGREPPGRWDRPGLSSVLHVPIERREFLFLAGAAATGTGLAGCASARPASAPSGDRSPGSAAPAPSPAASPPRDAGAQLGPQVVHGSRHRAQVALTFHGQGPVPMADALLAEAERAGARVTVLAVGTWLEQYPRIADRILRGGHDLGNHTMHHLDIAAMDASGAYAEIAECAQRLRALTGSIGRWFRPSQSHYSTPLIEQESRKVGYPTCVSYDVDSLDYTDPGPDAIVSTVLGSTRPGSIVSLHLGHSGTVTALPAILRGLARRGLRPVTLTELLSP
jgi:peptidoglycan/xylan/chitin deacetylase (PgdA/CDA1 family)